MDFRQSPLFARYMETTGWKVIPISAENYAYLYPVARWHIMRLSRLVSSINFAALKTIEKKQNVIFTKLEPDSLYDKKLEIKLKNHGYSRDNWSIEPSTTLCLDLKKTPDQLLKNMRSSCRANILKAQKKGVFIKESRDIDLIISIWQTNARRKGFLAETPQETKNLWQSFSREGKAKLFLASVKDKTVAASFLIFWGKTAHLWHLGFTGELPEVKAVNLLVWESILAGKREGYEIFDFEGVSEFKRGFGGDEVRFIGSYSRYPNNFLSKSAQIATSLKPDLVRTVYRFLKNISI